MKSTLFISLLSSTLLIPQLATAITPDETDAAKIMAAVQDRDDGDKSTSRILMVVKDNAGRERKRVVQSRRIDFPEGTKQLMLFESPADVRNTGMLSIDYDDGKKDDDQWLYLPSLRKSTRIASGDKSGSFMGTDLSFADMTSSDPKDYDYKILDQAAKVGDDACWLIEARANNAKTKEETGYVKSHIWVSKSKMMPLKAKNWVREGKKLKYIKFADIKQVNGIWVAHKILAQTRRGKEVESKTVIAFKSMKFNDGSVKADDFTQRRLEKGL
jgi:outer membrane lipoprotein-sorting protein